MEQYAILLYNCTLYLFQPKREGLLKQNLLKLPQTVMLLYVASGHKCLFQNISIVSNILSVVRQPILHVNELILTTVLQIISCKILTSMLRQPPKRKVSEICFTSQHYEWHYFSYKSRKIQFYVYFQQKSKRILNKKK